MIYVQLAREKSHFEHRSGNNSNLGENVAHAQPSVSQEEEEIQNSNFEYAPSKCPSEVKILKRMIENQEQRELKRSQKMRLRVGLRKR